MTLNDHMLQENSLRAVLARAWNERPLLTILIIAFVPRLVAVLFSKGFGMHDDHFGPIEQPFMIMHDISYWTSRGEPHGHSIVYPMLHFALFNVLEFVGIRNPQTTMFIVRLLHALYSLLIVAFGYKIAEHLSGRDTARKAGLLLGLFWALPFLGVRNLIEVVCIPPLMAGFYYVLKSPENRKYALYAGLWFGLAFTFRYQTLSMSGIAGIILLFQKNVRGALLLAAGFLLSALLIQGSADVFAWGYPFASFAEYMRYNLQHGEDYTTGPWYNYGLLIMGALIPPTSFLLLFGFFRNWRKTLIVFIPVMVFFILHSYFPNKQERFILPVVPLVLLLSYVGWEEFVRGSGFWSRHRRALQGMWVWFWVVNSILLVLFSTYYSKKSRIEAMYTLYGKPVSGLVLVGGKLGTTQPAYFYAGAYPIPTMSVNSSDDLAAVTVEVDSSGFRPNYVIVFGDDDLDERIQRVESSLGRRMILEKRIDQSFLDWVFYRLNPKYNKNEVTFVYKAEPAGQEP